MFRKSLMITAAVLIGLGTAVAHAEEAPPSAKHDFGWTQSGDGWRLAFVSDRDGDMEIYTIGVDGSEIRRLTVSPGLDVAPAFSPDGRLIAFVSTRDGQEEIYVMEADASGHTRLTSDPAWDFNPRFSADGQQILFDSNRDGSIRRYAISLDGSVPLAGLARALEAGTPQGADGSLQVTP